MKPKFVIERRVNFLNECPIYHTFGCSDFRCCQKSSFKIYEETFDFGKCVTLVALEDLMKQKGL